MKKLELCGDDVWLEGRSQLQICGLSVWIVICALSKIGPHVISFAPLSPIRWSMARFTRRQNQAQMKRSGGGFHLEVSGGAIQGRRRGFGLQLEVNGV